MIEIILVILIPYMSILSRMNGGKKPFDLPWGLDAFALALPYWLLFPIIGWWAALAYICAVVGLRMGHGRGFNYHLPFKLGSEPEKVEALIPDSLDVWTQKFLIMLLTGLAATIAASIVLMFHGHVMAGIVLALSGALKSVAYMAKRTETAEHLRGIFLGGGLVIVLLQLL